MLETVYVKTLRKATRQNKMDSMLRSIGKFIFFLRCNRFNMAYDPANSPRSSFSLAEASHSRNIPNLCAPHGHGMFLCV